MLIANVILTLAALGVIAILVGLVVEILRTDPDA